MTDAAAQLYAQETEFKLLSGMLPHVRATFLDIGAEKGSFARFLVGQGLRGVIFEPLPKHHADLAALTQASGSRYFPFAIDEQDGQAEFHIACGADGQPLDYFHSLQRLENDPRVHHRQKLAVVCRSLSSLQAEGVIDAEIGVLKIDTEGNDLRVMRGLGPVRADVMLCEFFTRGVYEGWQEAEPRGLIRQAEKLGYSRWIAIRRRGSAELVTLDAIDFTEKEWGNLVFLRESVFHAGREAIGHVIRETEEKLFNRLESPAAAKRRWRWLPW